MVRNKFGIITYLLILSAIYFMEISRTVINMYDEQVPKKGDKFLL